MELRNYKCGVILMTMIRVYQIKGTMMYLISVMIFGIYLSFLAHIERVNADSTKGFQLQ